MVKKVLISLVFVLLILVMGGMVLLPSVARVLAEGETLPVQSASQNDEKEEPCGMVDIFDQNGTLLSTRSAVELGDRIITRNFEVYEIVYVNTDNCSATAAFVERLRKPTVSRRSHNRAKPISDRQTEKKIGLYCTHNAESYVTGDGTDSYYGKGGIHDVASFLKNNLKARGVNALFDETLHLPHNSTAYDRSRVTAQNILSDFEPDAVFDIHRDGVARNVYRTFHNGKEKCQVSMVVGNSNPNKAATLQFALYLMSVAEELHPWLFKDILYASGHYNQSLSNKSMLFEMGTYLFEKDGVMESVPQLAEVIFTTLYGTAVNEKTGDLSIGEDVISDGSSVNDMMNSYSSSGDRGLIALWIGLGLLLAGGITVFIIEMVVRKKKKNSSSEMAEPSETE